MPELILGETYVDATGSEYIAVAALCSKDGTGSLFRPFYPQHVTLKPKTYKIEVELTEEEAKYVGDNWKTYRGPADSSNRLRPSLSAESKVKMAAIAALEKGGRR